MKAFSAIENSNINISDFLLNVFSKVEDISAVQIGAGCGGWERPNMGNQSPHINDPVWRLFKLKETWKVYLFEPVVSEFLDCVKFYPEDRFTVFNAGVVTHNHPFDNIYIRRAKTMSSMLGYHRKEHTEYGAIEKARVIPTVNITQTINTFTPYFLQMDVEGLDYNLVLELFKYGETNFKPKIISFEWCHAKESEIELLYKCLCLNGYEVVFKSNFDVVFSKIK